ncbi:MAG TPA: 23S rRNA (cytidine(2498)-2'-O)-methyltransferase RlmM, partial [Pseudomonadales bacterium]|nr:23S rRNA (cytidine(2498)-2'-O)-methyltransferase RlmM [Pseudomonadales bacterium]
RACMKLEEALATLLTPADQEKLLKPGMKVVDLGAAPGGWTWQMVRRNMFVTAIDNGPMNKELMSTGQVEHLRVDGFKFKPRKKVNWFLCDIVDKPSRVAQLVSEWVKNNYSDNYIFNLKLPMKKRVDEIEKCREKIVSTIPAGKKYKLVIKQLYHDRQEVTCFLSLVA